MGEGRRKPPFFLMGVYNNKKTYVASSAVKLFDHDAKVAQSTLISALFDDDDIARSLKSEILNGTGMNMHRFMDYAKNNYFSRLPLSSLQYMRVRDSAIIEYLESIETDPVTLHRVLLEMEDPELFLLGHLGDQGYSFLTNRIASVPVNIATQLQSDVDSHIVSLRVAEAARLDSIRYLVPQDRTVETPVVLPDSSPATEVKVYSVVSDDVISVQPVIDAYTIVSSQNLNTNEDFSYYYDLVYSHQYACTFHLNSHISYTETVTTYLRYPDNSTSSPTTEVLSPQTVDAGPQTNVTTFSRETTEVFTPEYIAGHKYYYIEYYTTDVDGNRTAKHLLFNSNPGTGEFLAGFPTEEFLLAAEFCPVVSFRRDNVNLFAPELEGTTEYDSSLALLNRLGIDAIEVAEGIHDNPDIGEVDHAFMMFGVNLLTENQAGIRYLCEFFEEYATIVEESVIDLGDEDFVQDPIDGTNRYADGGPKDLTSLSIYEDKFNVEINWGRIEVKYIQGTIGKTGFSKKEMYVNDAGNHIVDLYSQHDPDTYKHIRIYGLRHINKIYQGYSVQTDIQDLLDSQAEDGDEDYNLIIPLRMDLANKLNSLDRNELFYEAPHLVFYSIKVVKLKWYETSLFRAILIVAAVVLLITTGIELISTLITAASAGITAFLIALAKTIVKIIVTRLVMDFAVDVLGEELAFVIAVIALAVGLSNDSTGLLDPAWADTLLQTSVNIANAIARNVQDDMDDLNNAIEAFSKEASALTDELEALEELLKPSDLIDPFQFIDRLPAIDLNETPEVFFDRSVHVNNPGVLAYQSIEKYVDIQLDLPKPLHTF